MLKHFNYPYQIPELDSEKYKTSVYIDGALAAAGFRVHCNINGTTGTVAEIGSGEPGPVVVLRAGMDALGHIIDGHLGAHHTCGRDDHSSAVLTAAEEILAEGLVEREKLKVLFQPAEELGAGAIVLTEAGVLDDVEMLFGSRLWPLEECPMDQVVPAMCYSASATVMVDFHGKAACAARPYLDVNALDAASRVVQAVDGIRLAPSLTWGAKAACFLCDAGVTNSVPVRAYVCWDLCYEKNDGTVTLRERVVRAVESSAAAYGANVDIRVVKEMPATIIDAEATAIISQAICKTFDEAGLTAAKSTPGSGDFFHYLRLCPAMKGGLWGLGCNLLPGLHHPEMHFGCTALADGMRVFKSCVRQLLD